MTGPRVPLGSTQPPRRGTSVYDDELTEIIRRRRPALIRSAAVASTTTPDQQAKVLDLARESGLPSPLVARNPEQVERRVFQGAVDYEKLARQSPNLSRWLEGSENAAVAGPDVDRLSLLERGIQTALRAKTELAKGGISGLLMLPKAAGHIVETIGESTADPVLFPWLLRKVGKAVKGKAGEAQKSVAPSVGSVADVKEQGLGSLPEYLAFQLGQGLGTMGAVVAGAATAGPLGASAVGGSMAFGDVRDELEELGVEDGDPLKNIIAGVLAVPIAALDRMAPGDIASKMAARGASRAIVQEAAAHGLTRRVTAAALQVGLKEGSTEVAQEIIQYFGTRVATGSDVDLGEAGIRAADAFIGGKVSGATMGAVSQIVKEIGDASRQSELLQRSPQKLEEAVAEITRGTEAETGYIPIESFVEYFQGKGEDPGNVAEQVLGERQSFEQAIRTGSPLAIPISRYAVTLAVDHGAFFEKEMTLSPLEMNAREVEELAKATPAPTEAPADESAGKVGASIVEKLVAAGVDTDRAQTEAALPEAFFRTMGERAGIDPSELFGRYKVQITRPGLTDRQTPDIPALAERQAIADEKTADPYAVEPRERDWGAKAADGMFAYAWMTDGGKLRNVERVATAGLVEELARSLEANSADQGSAQLRTAINDYGEPVQANTPGRINARGRIVAREKTIAKIEAELARRGIDIGDALADQVLGTRTDDATDFAFEQSDDPTNLAGFAAEQAARAKGEAHLEGIRQMAAIDPSADNREVITIAAKHLKRAREMGFDRMAAQMESIIRRAGGSVPPKLSLVPASLVPDPKLGPDLKGQLPDLPADWRDRSDAEIAGWITTYREWFTERGWSDAERAELLAGTWTRQMEPVEIAAAVHLRALERAASPATKAQSGGRIELVLEQEGRPLDDVTARRLGIPRDLQDGINILAAERVWTKAMQTPGSEVVIRATGVRGRVVRGVADPVNGREMVLVEHEMDGMVGQRFYRPLQLEVPGAFEQEGKGSDPRGRIVFGEDGVRIELLKTANLSTFIHETGHFYWRVMEDLAASGASESIVRDVEMIRQWAGATEGKPLTRSQHEQIARGFEAYVMEGKAPSSSLRTVFARMRAWMVRVYRELLNLNVELTPEVRAVFGRMLASDEEIARAEAEQGVAPVLTDVSWLPEKEQQRYREAIEAAGLEAREILSTKVMRDYQRETSAVWKAERETIRAQIESEVSAERVYRVLAELQGGTMDDGAPFKLNKAAILSMFPEESGKEVLDALPKPKVYVSDGGLHPDVVAESFGYASGVDLVDALVNSERKADRIDRLTDERMRAEHPEMLTEAELTEEADKAVHNEKRGKFLEFQMRIMASQDFATFMKLTKRINSRVPTTAALESAAERAIAETPVGKIDPRLYQRAEAKAGRMARDLFAKGDIEGAFQALQQEAYSLALYRAAADAKERVDAIVKEARSYFRPDARIAESRDIDLVNGARAIVAAFGLGRTEKSPIEYLEALREYDEDTYQAVLSQVRSATQDAKPWREISFEHLVGMRDAANALWSLARRTQQVEIEGRVMAREQIEAELAAEIQQLGTPHAKRGYESAVSDQEKRGLGLLGWKASLRRVEHWVDAMDRGRPDGPFRKYLWTPISEATAQYRLAKKAKIEEYLAIVKAIEPSLSKAPIPAPELGPKGYTFGKNGGGKAELLGMLLHRGNDSNLDKLVRGRKWDPVQWERFEQRMQKEGILTKADYDYLQAVWDLFESLKPAVWKAHREMYGFYPSEVTARPFETPWGTYRGGYVPAKVDPFIVGDAAIRAEKESLSTGDNSFAFPTTGRGATRTRVQQYAKPLQMDLRFVPQHIDWALRFIHIEPRMKDVGRIVMSRKFRSVLDGFDPTVGGDMLVPWLQRAARQTIETPSKGWGGRAMDTFFRGLRRRTGMQIMVGNVTNALQQLTGLSLAAVKVKPRYLRDSLWRYVRQPRATAAMIAEKSDFMKTRITASTIEILATVDDLLLNPSTYEKARDFATRHGYFLQQGTQNVVDLIVWNGAYEQALADAAPESDAVRRADAAVRLTQGSFAPEDVTRFESGTPFVRAFTMFWSYFGMAANLLGSEFATTMREMGLRKGAGRMLYVYMFGFLIPVLLSEIIVQAGAGTLLDDDDDDGYLDEVLGLFFGSQARALGAMVPGVGPAVMAGINAFNDKWYDDRISTSPAVSTIERTVRAPNSVYDAIANDGSRRKAAQDLLTALGMLFGLPLAAAGRPVGYLLDVEDGEAEPEGVIDFTRGLITGRAGTPR